MSENNYPGTGNLAILGNLVILKERLVSLFTAEDERWALWSPVFLGLGIGLYFSLPTEPPLWSGVVATLALCLVVVRLKAVGWRVLGLGLGLIAVGFAVAQLRTATLKAPVLSGRIEAATIVGRLTRVEHFPKSVRITMELPRISRLAPENTPVNIRLRLRGKQPEMYPGDWIKVRGNLMAPPPPAAPGAFDFQRQSYFRRLGAVGFTFGRAKVTARVTSSGLQSIWLDLAMVRQKISERILAAMPGTTGAIASALMTGDRSSIPDATLASIRNSGLAHLLAISGLHIGLVAGILFFGFRAALSLCPALALRFPIKKWAAMAAIAGALTYAMLAGATVPSQRAFLMVGLVLLAVIVDRQALSMRTIAWAAAIVLLVQPESILGASFQMSFGAVVALIAAYEFLGNRSRIANINIHRRSAFAKLCIYVGGVSMTTIIAAAATAPFVIYNFNQISAYGLAANMIAVPVTAMWVMPWAIVAFGLMGIGLEHWALTPMGWGIDVVIKVAESISNLPGAISVLPSIPTWGISLVALGGIWLCLWQRRWRLWGLLSIAVGMASMAIIRPPDILVSADGKLMAVRQTGGKLTVSSMIKARFDRQVWMRRAGQESSPDRWPIEGFNKDQSLICDSMGCIYRAKGQRIALVRDSGALFEDCRSADVIISTVPVRWPCPSAHTVIDRFELWRNGAHALWIEDDGNVRIENVNQERGKRPWVAGVTRRAVLGTPSTSRGIRQGVP